MFTITDDRGRFACPEDFTHEPPVSSIVMTGGNYGNAWQRHGNDGLWHSTTGGKRRWSQLLRMRNLVLVYEATPERKCKHTHCDYDPLTDGQHRHVPVQTWATGRGN